MNATDALTRFRSARLAVVGDLMLDEYVWGEVDRISPEAPVPVVRVRRRTQVPGGAANTAAGIVALGGAASVVGVIGADDAGRALRRELDERGIGSDGVVVADGRATTTKTRVVAHSQQVVRTDVEELEPFSGDVEEQVLRAIEAGAGGCDALVISDYGKGVVSERIAHAAIERARERGTPVVVDPKGGDYSKYRGATIVTPNVHETELATRLQIVDDATLDRAVGDLRDMLDGSAVLVTRGAQGMALFGGSRRVDIPTSAQAVYDVTGAGDTVVAVLSLGLAAGIELEDAARLANAAAGIAVGKVGTASVEPEELAAAL